MNERDMGELEAGIGVEPLDLLLAKHGKLREQHAALWAKYGPGGVADNLRKAELSRIKEMLRAKAIESGVKMTEASLDDAAHDHADYRDFIALMLTERVKYFETDAKLRELDWRFQRGQGLLRYVTHEPR